MDFATRTFQMEHSWYTPATRTARATFTAAPRMRTSRLPAIERGSWEPCLCATWTSRWYASVYKDDPSISGDLGALLYAFGSASCSSTYPRPPAALFLYLSLHYLLAFESIQTMSSSNGTNTLQA